jgi:uncharacterized phage protein (TIGR01671 family)
MREIKFRAYEFDAKHMHYFTLWDLFLHRNILPALEAISEVMLSTGLKDMNDVEIYEGDFIQWMEGDVFLIDKIWPVSGFPSSYSQVINRSRDGKIERVFYEEGTDHWMKLPGFYKVIGNKYENPEFLEEVK